jgi:hypothetical protein
MEDFGCSGIGTPTKPDRCCDGGGAYETSELLGFNAAGRLTESQRNEGSPGDLLKHQRASDCAEDRKSKEPRFT